MSITINEALDIIYKSITPTKTKLINIEDSLGYILADDVVATCNLPPYNNSAMDGYAINSSVGGDTRVLKGSIFAGDSDSFSIKGDETLKIMTGAKIPNGCDCIVPIEHVKLDGSSIKILKPYKQNQNIRECAEDIKSGSTLIKKGEKLYAHHIMLLASQGISHVVVHKKPRVSVFASGNELKMHFESIEEHQLYNTNTITTYLRAKELGCEVEFLGTAKDSFEDIYRFIESSLDSDLVITTGGVSVGDADLTKEAFLKFGYEIYFDAIEIKPGKPTTFGKIGNTYILNLPGNPLAAMLNFELFAKSIILALSANRDRYLGVLEVTLHNDLNLKGGKTTILPGFYDGKGFYAMTKLSSGMVKPMSEANSFAIISKDAKEFKKGDILKILPTRFEFNSSMQSELSNI